VIAGLIYFALKAKPSCKDRIQNQGEENVDCGGPCSVCEKIPDAQNLKVVEKSIITEQPGKYDLLAQVENPNSQFGVASFEYEFDLKDEQGNVVSRYQGSSFILPSQKKYILVFNQEYASQPSAVDFTIKTYKFTKFLDYEEPLLRVSEKEFNLVNGGPTYAELKAKIRNESGFDFKEIKTKVIIRDKNNKVVAVNETVRNDVRVNEEREVIFNWTNSFLGENEYPKIEVENEVDVFDIDNYMKKHGGQEQYKTYDAIQN
jgi:translation elongation factor EF-1beta